MGLDDNFFVANIKIVWYATMEKHSVITHSLKAILLEQDNTESAAS